MYEYVSGELVGGGEDFAVVEVGGVGYRLTVPTSTSAALRGASHAMLFTALRVRDERFVLYGFATREEREIFERVCTISGIGPGTALAILSGVPIQEFRTAVLSGQARVLEQIKGIGRKTAQRLILELKDVIAAEGEVEFRGLPSEPADDAVAALLALGYNAPQAETLVRRVLPRLSSDATLEEIIKAATSLGRKTV